MVGSFTRHPRSLYHVTSGSRAAIQYEEGKRTGMNISDPTTSSAKPAPSRRQVARPSTAWHESPSARLEGARLANETHAEDRADGPAHICLRAVSTGQAQVETARSLRPTAPLLRLYPGRRTEQASCAPCSPSADPVPMTINPARMAAAPKAASSAAITTQERPKPSHRPETLSVFLSLPFKRRC